MITCVKAGAILDSFSHIAIIYTSPIVIKSYRDITTNITNMFLASGAPTAPPSIRFSDFSSFSHSSREMTDIYPG